jgi:hypothetical protein
MWRAVATALLLHAVQADPGTAAHWRTTQDLVVPRPGTMAVPLPIDTLDAALADLEDLRILDPSGSEVPWTPERPPRRPPDARAAAGLQTFLREGSTELVIRSGVDDPVGRIDLEIASWDFVKAARVEESDDGRTWLLLREDEPLFAVPQGARKTGIDLPPGRRVHLRVTLNDRRSPPVPVTGVRIVPSAPVPPPTEAVPVEVVERREEQGRTRFLLRFPGRHLRLADVTIDTPEPVFARRAELLVEERPVAKGTVHRTRIDGRPLVEERSLPAQVQLPTRDAVLLLHHGSSPPLRAETIRARMQPVRIYFAASAAGTYRLLAGNPTARVPKYDVAAIAEPGAEQMAVTPGPLRANPAWRPAEPLPGLMPAGAPLDVAAWRFRKEVILGPGEVHELELDPEVLSDADPSGADLRLLRDRIQVPYLRVDPPHRRTLSMTVDRMDQVDAGTTSRWSLRFPRRRLPIRRISCQTKDPLFQRQVRLVEELRDELGATHRVLVAQAAWSRTPDRPAERLDLMLDGVRRGDRLILEIENEDNPPLTLDSFDAEYAAPRLVFKSPSRSGLSLHYGNPGALPPRYDLVLASSELSSAIKSPATLGPGQPRTSSEPREEEAERHGSLYLWMVLGLLTLALLWVIIRVLPLPPEPSAK